MRLIYIFMNKNSTSLEISITKNLNECLSEKSHNYLNDDLLNKLLLCYAENVYEKKCHVLTQERWHELYGNESLLNKVEEIRREPNEDRQRVLKAQMPVALYKGVAFGRICDGSMCENGLEFIDVDVPTSEAFDRDVFFEQKIMPYVKQLDILLVTESMRCGLHIVARRLPNEEGVACTQRIARALGVEKWVDGCVKNPSRKAFVGAKVLYNALYDLLPHDDHEATLRLAMAYRDFKQQKQQIPVDISYKPKTNSLNTTASVNVTACQRPDTYRGVPYTMIVDRLVTNLWGSLAEVGGRHAQTMRLAYLLAQITDYDKEWVIALLPVYDPPLPYNEVQQIAEAGVGQRRQARLDKALESAIADCQRELHTTHTDSEQSTLPMPTCRIPLFKEMLSICPKGFESAVFWALMPMLGTLTSRCRMHYLSEQSEPIIFLVCWMGRQASGKSSMRMLEDIIMKYVKMEDQTAQVKVDQWREICSQLGSNKDRPTEPKVYQRMVGMVASVSAWAKNMQRALTDGRNLYSSSEEIDEAMKQKAAFNDKSTWMRKGNDGGMFSQEYLMKETFSGKTAVLHNFLLAGTPDRVFKYLAPHVHDGLAGRFVCVQLPTPTSAEIPVFRKLNERKLAVVDEIIQRLNTEEMDINLKKTKKALKKWLESKWDMALEAGDEALEVFRVRSANIACRVACILYLCNNHKETQSVVDLSLWAAEYCLRQQLNLWGSNIEKQADTAKTHNVQSLLVLLSQEFSREQLVQLRLQMGQPSNVRTIISRWKSSGLIEEIRTNHYRKK